MHEFMPSETMYYNDYIREYYHLFVAITLKLRYLYYANGRQSTER